MLTRLNQTATEHNSSIDPLSNPPKCHDTGYGSPITYYMTPNKLIDPSWQTPDSTIDNTIADLSETSMDPLKTPNKLIDLNWQTPEKTIDNPTADLRKTYIASLATPNKLINPSWQTPEKTINNPAADLRKTSMDPLATPNKLINPSWQTPEKTIDNPAADLRKTSMDPLKTPSKLIDLNWQTPKKTIDNPATDLRKTSMDPLKTPSKLIDLNWQTPEKTINNPATDLRKTSMDPLKTPNKLIDLNWQTPNKTIDNPAADLRKTSMDPLKTPNKLINPSWQTPEKTIDNPAADLGKTYIASLATPNKLIDPSWQTPDQNHLKKDHIVDIADDIKEKVKKFFQKHPTKNKYSKFRFSNKAGVSFRKINDQIFMILPGRIGSGDYGYIKKIINIDTNEEFALKISAIEPTQDDQSIQRWNVEKKNLQKLENYYYFIEEHRQEKLIKANVPYMENYSSDPTATPQKPSFQTKLFNEDPIVSDELRNVPNIKLFFGSSENAKELAITEPVSITPDKASTSITSAEQMIPSSEQLYWNKKTDDPKHFPVKYSMKIGFIMKLFKNNQTMQDFLKNNPELTILKKLDLLLMVVEKINVLRQKQIIHNDLHLNNILVILDPSDVNSFNIEIIDFGASTIANKKVPYTNNDLYKLKTSLQKNHFYDEELFTGIFKQINYRSLSNQNLLNEIITELKKLKHALEGSSIKSIKI